MSSKDRAYKFFFDDSREEAIKRDGEKCVNCGMTRTEHKQRYNRDITVDHIDGKGRNTPKAERNNSMDNLQTLCLPCHGHKDVRRKLIFEDAQDIRMFKARGLRPIDIAKCYQMVLYRTILQIVNNKIHKTPYTLKKEV